MTWRNGWYLLYEEFGGRGLELPFQYRYIHFDIEEAMKYVTQGRVLVLVNECYEASLLLLQQKMSDFFPDVSHQDVVDFASSHQDNRGTYEGKDETVLFLQDLRAKAQMWFANDFLFYHHAVAQFRTELEGVGLECDAL